MKRSEKPGIKGYFLQQYAVAQNAKQYRMVENAILRGQHRPKSISLPRWRAMVRHMENLFGEGITNGTT